MFQVETDFFGQRFAKELQSRKVAPYQAQRFQIQELHIRDKAKKHGQTRSDGQTKEIRHASAPCPCRLRPMRVEGNPKTVLHLPSRRAISPRSRSWSSPVR